MTNTEKSPIQIHSEAIHGAMLAWRKAGHGDKAAARAYREACRAARQEYERATAAR